ncbi:MAG: endonuclease [Butyrivibrio sp.]|nr:endonuclease [Butyrivibrio sp.]
MKQLKYLLISLILIAALLVLTVLGYLTVDEYQPEDEEYAEVEGSSFKIPVRGTSMRLLSWNIGYGGLGDNADFFMDGGHMVYTADKERVYANLDGIISEIEKIKPSAVMLQEVDRNSARTYFTDDMEYLTDNSDSEVLHGESVYSSNYRVSFVPLPVPPIGRVEAGIATFCEFDIDKAERISLPCSFSWPYRTINLKRCIQISRTSVADSDKELVLINLHLEAYDEGEGKIAQTKILKDIIQKEVDKGNYVIAGGDFNQCFSGTDTSAFPALDVPWQAGRIDESEFGPDVTFYADESTASCRSLDRPLDTAPDKSPNGFQYYIIDGFIVSSNIEVMGMYTDDLGFVSADHNPVILDFTLK